MGAQKFENCVSIHPYFLVEASKFDEYQAILKDFVARAKTESGCYFYGFTKMQNEDGSFTVFCRECYHDADAALVHLKNVEEQLQKAEKLSKIVRFEIHGGADQLEKLKAPMAALNPTYFVVDHGFFN